MTGYRPPPARHWRSYGDDKLPTGGEALSEPFAAFPSWFMRIECDRCGKVRMINETHTPQRAFCAQYLGEELARREQDRQAEIMVSHAATVKNCTWGITIMTIVIMFATVWGMVHSH